MAEGNAERVQRLIDRVNRGEPPGDLIHPDVEWYASGALPDVENIRGRDAVEGWWGGLSDAFDEFRVEAEDFVEIGDHVVMVATQIGLGRGSRVPVELRVVAAMELQEKQVVWVGAYRDKEQAIQAVASRERASPSRPTRRGAHPS